jgi:ribosomal protein S18 acetylase RimI-like enzyme
MDENATAQGSGTPDPSQGRSPREREEAFYAGLKKPQQPQAGDGKQTPKPKPVQTWWERVRSGVEGKSRIGEIARSVPRGLANAGNNIARTAAEAGAMVGDALGVGGTEAQQDARRERAKDFQLVSEGELDATYGPRSDDPLASLAEGLTQALAVGVLTRGAGVKNAIAQGAVIDGVAFNPYEAGISEALARHADKLPVAGKYLREIGKLGSVDADDSFVEARLKRIAEGSVVGAVIDRFAAASVATVRVAKARTVLSKPNAAPAEIKRAEKTIKEAEKTIKAVQEGTYTPEGARVVSRPNPDGTTRLQEMRPAAAADEPFTVPDRFAVAPAGEAGAVEVKDLDETTKVVVVRGADGAPAGYIQVGRAIDGDGWDVHDVMVDPKARRQGLGRRLYTEAKAAIGDEDLVSGRMSLSQDGEAIAQKMADEGVVRMAHGDSPRFEGAEGPVQAATADFAIRSEEPRSMWSEADTKVHFEIAERIKSAPTEKDAIDIVGSEDHFNLRTMANGEDFNAQLRALVSRFQQAFSDAKGRPVISREETLAAAESYAKDLGIEDWADRVARQTSDENRLRLSVETVLKARAVHQVGDRIAELSTLLNGRPDDPALLSEARRLLDLWQGLSLEAFEHTSEVGRALNVLQALQDSRAKRVQFRMDAESRAVKSDPSVPKSGTNEPAVTGTKAPTEELPGDPSLDFRNDGAPDPKPRSMAPRKGKQPAIRISSDMTDEELLTMTRLFQRAGGDPRNLHAVLKGMHAAMRENAVRDAGKAGMAKFMDKVNTVFINSLISGAKTFQSIFQSGAALNMMEGSARLLAGISTGNRGLATEGAAYLYALGRYAKENIIGAAAAFREGTSVLEGAAPQYLRSGVTGTVVTVPGRIAGSLDEFTKLTAYRADEFAKALRSARESGKDWREAIQQAEADVRVSVDQQTGVAMNPLALERAGVPTLSQPLGRDTPMGKIVEGLNGFTFGKLFVPFVRPSVNTFRYVWQNTPLLNRFNAEARAIMEEGAEEATVLHARSALAGSLMVYSMTKFMEGGITGDGPKDRTLRAIWQKNHQPYSIRIGGRWVSYRRMEPFASWMGLVADAMEAVHEIDSEGERQSILGAVFMAMVKNTYNKSWTSGLSNVFAAIEREDARSVERVFSGIVSGFVPQAISQFNTDPYLREARGIVDATRSRIPGLSADLPAKFDFTGEPVMKQGSLWNRNFSTFQMRSAAPVTLEDALLEHEIKLTPFPQKLARGLIDLNDPKWEKGGKTPYVRLMELLREGGLRAALEAEVKSQEWQEASGGTPTFPGGEKAERLKIIKDVAEQKALRKVLDEYESLGLKQAYKGAQFVVPNVARYKGPDAETAAREKYGLTTQP